MTSADTPTVDAANIESVRKQRRTIKSAEKENQEFYRQIFASKVGRRLMWDILRSAHTFETMFPAGPVGFPDANAAWFHAGQTALGQVIWKSWLRLDRVGVLLMMEENDDQLGKMLKPK